MPKRSRRTRRGWVVQVYQPESYWGNPGWYRVHMSKKISYGDEYKQRDYPMTPRTLEEAVEYVKGCKDSIAVLLSEMNTSYRIINIYTGEVIPVEALL